MSPEILFLSNRPQHPCSHWTASYVTISPSRFLSSKGQIFPGFWSSQGPTLWTQQAVRLSGTCFCSIYPRKYNFKSSPYYIVSIRVEMEETSLGWPQPLIRKGQGPQLGLIGCLQGVLSLQKILHALEPFFKSGHSWIWIDIKLQ